VMALRSSSGLPWAKARDEATREPTRSARVI
jgi:hypothetical protein